MGVVNVNLSGIGSAVMMGWHSDEFMFKERGRRRVIVGTGPAIDHVPVIATDEPLTKHHLINYFLSGSKPKQNWRIGTEHEKFGFDFKTLHPITYKQISALLNGIAVRFDWDKIMENDNIIGLKKDKQSISLEPGGQLELSGAPVKTLYQTCGEINSHLYQAKTVAEEMGIGFLGLGFQPKWRLEDIPGVPKVNLDFSSEADMIKKMRASIALQPLATALFANSPFKEGVPNGYLSIRSLKVNQVDKRRTGTLPFVFYDTFGFEQYVDYALDVPMVFVYRKNKYIECDGMSFRVGLLYDEVSLQNALDMIADWTPEDIQNLRNKVPITGLNTPFQGRLLRDIAEDVLKWAKEGLDRRCLNESIFLDPLEEVATTGLTQADKLLKMYDNKWGNNVDAVLPLKLNEENGSEECVSKNGWKMGMVCV
ncbi:hypothetical protein Fmac_002036 [Flemingia macrophylla]|uniref:Glutamate--cysteine ligase n=1 Tax=Flemingia macrophylla TaxID=520843 RepID=A0ABD1NIX2_9FABA